MKINNFFLAASISLLSVTTFASVQCPSKITCNTANPYNCVIKSHDGITWIVGGAINYAASKKYVWQTAQSAPSRTYSKGGICNYSLPSAPLSQISIVSTTPLIALKNTSWITYSNFANCGGKFSPGNIAECAFSNPM